MNNLAIIPARGGSKRIPRKNIKDFLGKPIIAYSIEVAFKSGLFEEVMVSTDDLEIAELSKQYGAKVPFLRTKATSNDYAIIADVLLEVLSCYRGLGRNFDNICCILSTAPLLSPKDIIQAFQKFHMSEFDAIYPIVTYSYPIMRSLIMDENSNLRMRWPEYSNVRSQDIEPAYHDSGTFYWMKTKSILNPKGNLPLKYGGIIMDEIKVQDIDNDTDWKLAELKFKLLHGDAF